MEYYIFMLGYDLLNDLVKTLPCDEAHDFCTWVYDGFEDSGHSHLNEYINEYYDSIKEEFEERYKFY